MLTENPAVLQYLAETGLLPAEADARARVRQWLSVLEAHLQHHEHHEGGCGIADIYLAVMLNWAP